MIAVLWGNDLSTADRSLIEDFGACRAAEFIHNGSGVKNQEEGGRVEVCRGPVRSWAALWPSLRHYD
jgi:hypothetical protein